MSLLYKAFYWIFLAAVIIIGGFLILSVLPIPGHIETKIVKSGSMTPAIPVGAVVVIKPESSYEVGQVITFGPDTATQVPTTHRIYSISGTGASELFTTKGDANDAPDPTQTPLSQVHGKVILDIPYIGYILAFAKTKLGFLLLVGVPALAVCIEESFKIVAEVRGMRKNKNKNQNKRDGDPDEDQGQGQRGNAPRRPGVLRLREMRMPYHMPVRRVRTLVMGDGIVPPSRPPQPPIRMAYVSRNTLRLQPSVRFGGGIGAALVVILLVGISTAGRAAGDTLSYYRSSQTSPGNRFQSGTYPAPPAPVTPDVQSFSADFALPDTSDTSDASSSDASTTDTTDTSDTPPPADPSSDASSTDTTYASTTDPVVTPPDPTPSPTTEDASDTPSAPPADTSDDSSSTPPAPESGS